MNKISNFYPSLAKSCQSLYSRYLWVESFLEQNIKHGNIRQENQDECTIEINYFVTHFSSGLIGPN